MARVRSWRVHDGYGGPGDSVPDHGVGSPSRYAAGNGRQAIAPPARFPVPDIGSQLAGQSGSQVDQVSRDRFRERLFLAPSRWLSVRDDACIESGLVAGEVRAERVA